MQAKSLSEMKCPCSASCSENPSAQAQRSERRQKEEERGYRDDSTVGAGAGRASCGRTEKGMNFFFFVKGDGWIA